MAFGKGRIKSVSVRGKAIGDLFSRMERKSSTLLWEGKAFEE